MLLCCFLKNKLVSKTQVLVGLKGEIVVSLFAKLFVLNSSLQANSKCCLLLGSPCCDLLMTNIVCSPVLQFCCGFNWSH